MLISVIIPTCDRIELLCKCLDLLAPGIQSVDSSTYEVIVTDDSKLATAKALIEENYKWAIWQEGPKYGPASNRNSGAKNARGEWLVFIDDDCLPHSNWLASYCNVIKSTHYEVFEGCTKADRLKLRYDEEAPVNILGDKLWSCNFAIKKSLFRKLNGFDHLFPYAAMEDVDFHKRVKLEANILFVPDALVIHPWRRMKPFQNLKKRLKSHQYYKNKHFTDSSMKFKWDRVKIFIGYTYYGFRELKNFSFRGWTSYLERCVFNFLMLFI